MTSRLDAAARLAEGQPAVADVEAYVAACHRLGYQHGDLTAYANQVRERYDSEEGLDLRALDADCSAFAVAAAAIDDAARTHTELVARVAMAWSGHGATAAHEFVWRSGQAGVAVSSAVRAVTDVLVSLRDEVWRAVDGKVDAVQGIDARHQAQRAEWLAAARVVTTGHGDVAAASELVDLQVKPFVHVDIGSDWVTAMRTATASIDAAYDDAIAGVSLQPSAAFDVPGQLGPVGPNSAAGQRDQVDGVAAAAVTPEPRAAAQTPGSAMAGGPAAATVPSAWAPPGPGPGPMAAASPPAAPVPSAASMPSMPSMGDLGGTPSPPGGGAGGLGQQLADLIGGLLGSLGGGADDPAALGESESIDDPEDGPSDGEDAAGADDDDSNVDPDEEDERVEDQRVEDVEQPVTEPAPAAESAPAAEPDPAVTGVPLPPVPQEPPPPIPAEGVSADPVGGPTPCEIAADELPQVGE